MEVFQRTTNPQAVRRRVKRGKNLLNRGRKGTERTGARDGVERERKELGNQDGSG
jgi:hypothetical protein